jgi:hypothetical protein
MSDLQGFLLEAEALIAGGGGKPPAGSNGGRK